MAVDLKLATTKALSTAQEAGAYLLARPIASAVGLVGLSVVLFDYRAWVAYG